MHIYKGVILNWALWCFLVCQGLQTGRPVWASLLGFVMAEHTPLVAIQTHKATWPLVLMTAGNLGEFFLLIKAV